MANKLTAAVIGCGRIGAEFDTDPKRDYISTHAGSYAVSKDTELVAVCDTNRQKAIQCAERWGIKDVFKDAKKMMSETRPELISICTPPGTHYPVLKEIIKYRPKAVFCEKPIASDVRQADKMIELCREHDIILQVDHQRRFDELHTRIREAIEKREFGRVQQVNFYYTAGIRNTGSHMFDLMRFFFKDVEWIEAFYAGPGEQKKKDPDLDGIIRFKDGLFATFQACDVKNYLLFEANIIFDKARIVLKNSGFNLEYYRVKDSSFFSGYKELSRGKKPFNTIYKRNFMLNAVKELVSSVRGEKRTVSSGEDGRAALKMIECAVRSADGDGNRISIR
jgi:predicted dehydrogenase